MGRPPPRTTTTTVLVSLLCFFQPLLSSSPAALFPRRALVVLPTCYYGTALHCSLSGSYRVCNWAEPLHIFISRRFHSSTVRIEKSRHRLVSRLPQSPEALGCQYVGPGHPSYYEGNYFPMMMMMVVDEKFHSLTRVNLAGH